MSIPEETASGILTCDISDNLPVFIIRKSAFTQSNPQNQFVFKSYRSTNAFNVDKLNDVLSYRLFSFNFSQHHNVLFDKFLDLMFETYRECCPIKHKLITSKQAVGPWINNELKSKIKLRQSYYLLWKKGLLSETFCKNFRNKVTSEIRSAKKKTTMHGSSLNSEVMQGRSGN